MTEFVQQLVNGLSNGAIYALIALGYTMVYGILKLINFAHGEVFMVGAFAGLMVQRGVGTQLGVWVLLLAIVAAGVAGGTVAFLIERIAYRPLRKKPRIIALITAIGVSIFIQNVVALLTRAAPYFWQPVFVAEGSETALYAIEPFVTYADAFVIGGALALMLLLQYIVYGTKMGKAMRAVSQNLDVASLMGINVNRVIAFTFVLAGGLAGAGAVLVGQKNGSVNYIMGLMPGLKAFVAAVLGGIGSVPGALAGGLILGFAETFVAAYLSSSYRDAIAFAVLIAVLLVRPSGIFGKYVPEKV
ncbi:MAG: branched-chain amino acid ABC transporter permease [Deltaproteobacteria bacterium]|nr:branched-chain amino acid ABC transporter permease [Deltaproteobacteria bacterium]